MRSPDPGLVDANLANSLIAACHDYESPPASASTRAAVTQAAQSGNKNPGLSGGWVVSGS
jgi:hypothetical protein